VRVLLVDDSKTMRKLLRKNLEAYAFEYVEAENGQVALNHLADQDFDLVITDVNMPEMDGFSMCHQIRNVIQRNQNVKIIVLSTETPAQDQISQLIISDYVIKPPPPGEIEKKIEQILGVQVACK